MTRICGRAVHHNGDITDDAQHNFDSDPNRRADPGLRPRPSAAPTARSAYTPDGFGFQDSSGRHPDRVRENLQFALDMIRLRARPGRPGVAHGNEAPDLGADHVRSAATATADVEVNSE
jgi:hypothetical protein